jgi:hypothetical protein
MAKDTMRDRVWKTTLQLITDDINRETPESAFDSHVPEGFTKRDIEVQVEAGVRTVHDVLKTMVDYAILDESNQQVKVSQGGSTAIHEATVYSAGEMIGVLSHDSLPKQAQPSDCNTDNPGEYAHTGETDQDTKDSMPTRKRESSDYSLASSETEVGEIGESPFGEGVGSRDGFIESIRTVGQQRADSLVNAGFDTYNDLYQASLSEITEVYDIGETTAKRIKIRIGSVVRTKCDVSVADLAEMPVEDIANIYHTGTDLAGEIKQTAKARQMF